MPKEDKTNDPVKQPSFPNFMKTVVRIDAYNLMFVSRIKYQIPVFFYRIAGKTCQLIVSYLFLISLLVDCT